MMEQMNNEPLRLGLDANMVIYLTQLNSEKYDPENKVKTLLENHEMDVNIFRGLPAKDLPPILVDGYLSEIITLPNGIDIYGHLQDVYKLLKKIKSGEIRAYISPTVRFLIEGNSSAIEFIDAYISEIKVQEDDQEFWTQRKEIACAYAKAGAVPMGRDAVNLTYSITAHGCIVAEYALCGLNFVTANARNLVHVDVAEKDYRRRNKIETVNWEQGLRYMARNGKEYATCPLLPEDLRGKLNSVKKGGNPIIDFVDMRVDEDNNFLSR